MWTRHVGKARERDVTPYCVVITICTRQQSARLSSTYTHRHTPHTHTHTMYFIQLLRVSYVMESKITTAHFLFSWPNYLYANFGWSDSVASRTVAHKHTNTHRHLSQFWISLPMLAGKHAHTAAYKISTIKHENTCTLSLTCTHTGITYTPDLLNSESLIVFPSCYHLKFCFKCLWLCCHCSRR